MVVAAVVLWHLAVILCSAYLRVSPAERPYALPVAAPAAAWPMLAATLAVVAVVAVAAALARVPRGAPRRTLLGALAMPAAVLAWLWWRPAVTGPHPLDAGWAVAVVLLAVALARGGPRRPTARLGLVEGRAWRAIHAGLAVVAVALAASGHAASWRSLGLSLALYPLYALVQLALVLVLPLPRLASLAGPGLAAAACAALFALLHWPNAVLMVASGVAMAYWAREYAHGRSLPALALSMGLAATALAQLVPDAALAHMRVGQGYARLRAVPALAKRGAQAAAGAERPVAAFVGALYPAVVGRPAGEVELARWEAAIWPARRGAIAWYLHHTPEYRRRHGPLAGAPRDGDAVPWTTLPAPWRARIARFAAPDYGTAGGGSWPGFVAAVFADVLGRPAGPADLAAWPEALSRRERERLVEVLLARHRALARAPFDTLTVEQLELRY